MDDKGKGRERRGVKSPGGQRSKPEDTDNDFISLVDALIAFAVSRRASDIHIEPYFFEKIRIRLRIDGILLLYKYLDEAIYWGMITRLKVLAGMDIAERRLPQDGNFYLTLGDRRIDVRVSVVPTVYGEKMVLRILDGRFYLRQLDLLGFSAEDLEKVRRMAARRSGLIIITGPTGCGKTTTLYSMLQTRNQISDNITSIEEPVETHIPGINQIQINEKIDLTFESTLRSVLRQDPNIIMIGEIRDSRTALAVVRAAMTGHLVLTTLHTTDAFSAVIRLLDMGVPDYLLAGVLEGIVAQRLVRRLCPACKKGVMANAAQTAALRLDEPVMLFEPVGCPRCAKMGFLDRTGIFDILVVDDALRMFIRNVGREGMKDPINPDNAFFKDMRRKITEGITSFSEGMRVLGD